MPADPTAAPVLDDLVALPSDGRRFTRRREVRLADASPSGRLRLDALARFLQDIANDDARDAIGADAAAWVVRKTVVDVFRWPRFQEPVELTTFCGGIGPRWAERRTSVAGAAGGLIEAASLWIHIDLATNRPAPLPASFHEHFGAGGHGDRKVGVRLSHGAPPDGAAHHPWVFRSTDFDVMGHVNNAAYWAVVEELLPHGAPARFELEYRSGVEPHHGAEVVVDGEALWIVGDGTVHASARRIER